MRESRVADRVNRPSRLELLLECPVVKGNRTNVGRMSEEVQVSTAYQPPLDTLRVLCGESLPRSRESRGWSRARSPAGIGNHGSLSLPAARQWQARAQGCRHAIAAPISAGWPFRGWSLDGLLSVPPWRAGDQGDDGTLRGPDREKGEGRAAHGRSKHGPSMDNFSFFLLIHPSAAMYGDVKRLR